MDTPAALNLRRYRCRKVVDAARIESVFVSGCQITVRDAEGYLRTVTLPTLMAVVEPEPGDYLLCHADGRLSVSTRVAFEDGYTRAEDAP